jgi:protein-tyrosine phosphatase
MDLDIIPDTVTHLGAALGLLSAPGPGSELAENLAILRDAHACALLVSLTADFELTALGIADLVEQGGAMGIAVLRFPIANFDTPESPGVLAPVVERILGTARSGGAVMIHCWAGLGRSGLVAASVLAAQGTPSDEAIATVRRYRRGAVETSDQEAYVHDFARWWGEASRSSRS